MVVTIYLQTDFGPYLPGTKFITSLFHARRLVQEYNTRNVIIVDVYGRESTIYDGATLYVRQGRSSPPPSQDNTVLVHFRVDIDRWNRGTTYRFRVGPMRRYLNQHPNVALYYGGSRIDPSLLDEYARYDVVLQADYLFTTYLGQ